MSAGAVAAVDLGATSGRVIVGHVGPDTLDTTSVARFANDPVKHLAVSHSVEPGRAHADQYEMSA